MKTLFALGLVLPGLAFATALPRLSTPRVSPAVASDADGKVYVVGGGAAGAERWDPVSRRWSPIASPNGARIGAGLAWLGDKLVLAGGGRDSAGLGYASDLEIYDPATNQWSTAAAKTAGRRDVAVASNGRTLWITGGSGPRYSNGAPAILPDPGEENFLDAWGVRLVEAVTLESRSVAKAMARRRSEHAAVFAAGKLYALGGSFQGDMWGYPEHPVSIGVSYLNPTVEAYDPATNTWVIASQLPTPRAGVAAAVDAAGRIYVIGGRARGPKVVGTVEIFDPTSGKWTTGQPMPTPRTNFGLARTADGLLLAVGGKDANGRNRAVVEAYDPVADRWLLGDEPTNPLDALGFAGAENDFLSAAATTPDTATFGGWFAGRCWDARHPDETQGGLLMAERKDGTIKVLVLKSETTRLREWFDVLDDAKRVEIRRIRSALDTRLLPARVVDGALASVLSPPSEGRRSIEYQVKKLSDGWAARAVSLETGATLVACRLVARPSSR